MPDKTKQNTAMGVIELNADEDFAEILSKATAEAQKDYPVLDDDDDDYNYEKLDEFGLALTKHRSESIAYRKSSNIEEIWIEDEDFYEGIDDDNRMSEQRTIWAQKPPGSISGPSKPTTQSTVFPNITAPFVNAGTARLADVILPNGAQAAWSFTPTPIPDLIAKAEGTSLSKGENLSDAELDPDAAREQATTENTEMEAAQAEIDEGKRTAERAEKRIQDWHLESKRRVECRLIIDDAGRLGVGVMKGPFNQQVTRMGYVDGKIQILTKTTPHSKRIDPWNFFPARDCAEDIQNGDGVWERDYISKKQLREFLDDESYIQRQVLLCLTEGPIMATEKYKDTPGDIRDPVLQDKYEIWYYYGTAERAELESGGCDCTDIEDPHMPAAVVMVNNHIIRAALNPLDTGQYPYSVFRWGRRSGHWAGIGISRQVREAQRIVNGATRNLMDNAGLAAGPMIVFQQGVLTAANNVMGLGPRKVFYVKEDAVNLRAAKDAIGIIQIDMLVDDLIKIIQFGLKLAEDTTGLPLLLQGQMGSAPDTVGGMRLLQNNTAPPLRRLARAFDNDITEPEIERYYIYLLQYGEHDDEKGDFFISATGSSTLAERDLQDQEIAAIVSMSLDPRFKLDPAKAVKQFILSRRFDPDDFEMDEDGEAYQQLVEAANAPPQDPRLQVAEMQGQTKMAVGQMDNQTKIAQMQSTENLKATDMVMKQQMAQLNNEQEMAILEANKQIELILAAAAEEGANLKTDADRQQHAEKIKSDIAREVMKIRSVERLAGMGAAANLLPKPPIEPVGRAPAGESYQK